MKNALPPDAIHARLQYTYTLFHDIRQKFNKNAVERGGYERADVTSMYVRKYGVKAYAFLGGAKNCAVESSFTEEQERYIDETLTSLTGFIVGKYATCSFADRVTHHYVHTTAPYFVLAMLGSTEALLNEYLNAKPEDAAILDAIFRVAGGEGFRDLMRIYGADLLDGVLTNKKVSQPKTLAFVDLHDCYRKDDSGKTLPGKYEVWCPGRSLARAYLNQCQIAAQTLANQHGVRFAPSTSEEFQAFPQEISIYMKQFLQAMISPILEKYGIT
ncbi:MULTISPECIES: hypothetical protein [unclassified Leptolyngbya]|uniref:hypothetical protein n=1 Tax=unclassified Leptolyngbya TaxID=2650499 RepID=UPI0016828871|nr:MULTISPECIES: hypothetical protein [unclassified Leptolyngbya]MBD1909781.1 hypothetical protein [Leptolyngbya sp. FACHB-8]MBD2157680.1 hypothetical protein [Leptolyngbya sp. FACHB-16]